MEDIRTSYVQYAVQLASPEIKGFLFKLLQEMSHSYIIFKAVKIKNSQVIMVKPFVERFREYLINLTQVMRGETAASSIFPNTTDNGQSKELIFIELLKQHLPNSCNIFMGGFIFNLLGEESNQIDIIISDYQSLKFDALKKDGGGKSFACVDGTIGVISIKSQLDRDKLFDSLMNIASIPTGTVLDQTNSDPSVSMEGMKDGFLKVIFALNGIKAETVQKYVEEFYTIHPQIPLNRRPNYIHVLGNYSLIRLIQPLQVDDGFVKPEGAFCIRNYEPDLYFISSLIISIEKISRLHRHIFYDYTNIFELAVPIQSTVLPG